MLNFFVSAAFFLSLDSNMYDVATNPKTSLCNVATLLGRPSVVASADVATLDFRCHDIRLM